MIHKAIIVVLTLGAVAIVVLAWSSMALQKSWTVKTPSSVWIVGAADGMSVIFYISSSDQSALRWEARNRNLPPRFGDAWLRSHWISGWHRYSYNAPGTGLPVSAAGLCVPVALPFAMFGAYPGVLIIRRIRRWHRRRRGFCARCTYNLTGNVSGVCPECGTEIESP
jgi:hypothetical protein